MCKPKYEGRSVEEWHSILGSSHRDQRRLAVRALANLGPSAVEAVPSLVELLDEQDTVLLSNAIEAIGAIVDEPTTELVEVLGKQLEAPHSEVREAAGQAIYRITSRRRALTYTITPTLRRALRDSDPKVRRLMLDILTRPGNSHRHGLIVVAVAATLRDPETAAREQAIRQLSEPHIIELVAASSTLLKKSILESLASAAKDPIESVREAAILTLGELAFHDAVKTGDVLSILVDLLQDPKVQSAVFEAFYELGDVAQPVVHGGGSDVSAVGLRAWTRLSLREARTSDSVLR